MLIVPDKNQLQESLGLAERFGLGFEYNDFYHDLDNISMIDSTVLLYQKNKQPLHRTLHGAFYDIIVGSMDDKIRTVSRERIQQSLGIGKRLCADAVVFHTNFNPLLNFPGYIEQWLNENTLFYAQLLENNKDMNVFVENMFDFTPNLLAELASRLQQYPNFGVCLDLAHSCISPTPLEIWLDMLAPYIRHCHINDCDGLHDLHLPLGQGVLDITGFFGLLEKYRLTPSILLEVTGTAQQVKCIDFLIDHNLM